MKERDKKTADQRGARTGVSTASMRAVKVEKSPDPAHSQDATSARDLAAQHPERWDGQS